MQPEYLVCGTILLALASYMAIGWRNGAEVIQRWYEIMSEPDGRPWWRRGHFRPNRNQAAIVAWLVIIGAASLGSIFLAVGLGLDLGENWK